MPLLQFDITFFNTKYCYCYHPCHHNYYLGILEVSSECAVNDVFRISYVYTLEKLKYISSEFHGTYYFQLCAEHKQPGRKNDYQRE